MVKNDNDSPLRRIRDYVEQYREQNGADEDLDVIVRQWVRDWAQKLTSNEA